MIYQPHLRSCTSGVLFSLRGPGLYTEVDMGHPMQFTRCQIGKTFVSKGYTTIFNELAA